MTVSFHQVWIVMSSRITRDHPTYRPIRKNTGTIQNSRVALDDLHMNQGSSFLSLSRSPRPPSHHLSSLTYVYLVPALHLLPPLTPFWPYGTHQFSPRVQTISILSAGTTRNGRHNKTGRPNPSSLYEMLHIPLSADYSVVMCGAWPGTLVA